MRTDSPLAPLRDAIFALALISCAAAGAAEAAESWTEQDLAAAAALRDHALAGTSAYTWVDALTTEIGPRFAGSSGDAAAVRWAMQTLGRLGFSKVRSQDVLVPRWVRGETRVAIVGPGAQPLVAVTLGGSIGTGEDGIEAQVLEVGSLEQLEALPAATVDGKVVFINEAMERTRDMSGYANAVAKRVQGPSAAARLGAVALLIRSVGTSNERVAHTGALRYALDAPRIPAFALSNPDADLLSRRMAAGKPVRVALESSARELSPRWSANVIGEIVGREYPDEIVLLGAHLDSWDITPGVLDAAAGVAIVIEAAHLISKLEHPPARTVRIVLFANAEFGLSGAREYAKALENQAASHVIAMESDLGAGPIWRLGSQVAPDAASSIDAIRELLAPLSIEAGGNQESGGPNLDPLRALGVPVLTLAHDARPYFDVHHTINDTLTKIDREVLDRTVAAYTVAAYLAATKQGGFGRLPLRADAQ